VARAFFTGLAMYLAAGTAGAQLQQTPDSRTVLGGGDEYLSAAADAIRAGEYEDGIRLTTLGLERPQSQPDRAAALSNLCAAHAAKGEPDAAIKYCDESIAMNEHNWRAYINRSYAYYLKRMFTESSADLAVAETLNPTARQIEQIRGMINERSLQPSVIVEEHQ
jgi:tetratricopeptide (TPR) repeat protein